MEKTEQRLVIGSLLHDFGKLLYRYNDGRNHSTSGYDYLKGISLLAEEKDILNCVLYHHGNMLKNASVESNALCYITYIADNIAAAADRREKDGGEGGFIREAPYESIFNILNGNSDNMVYKPSVMSVDSIVYPTEEKISYNEAFYQRVIDNIRDSLKGIELTDEYVNSLLQLLEANLTSIPSSTQTKELADISLYDHVKLTAAFALCIKQYLDEKGVVDYREELFNKASDFYNKKAFRMYSMDLSGIQSFIYNIGSKSALKGLRARSFYLEILLEASVDELLNRAGLCRANVLYTGGGHTYIIMPATSKTEGIIESFERELNEWLTNTFDIGLYTAGGYGDCSSNDLKNKPNGSYKSIFTSVSKNISKKKLHRYSSEDIFKLNHLQREDYSRECSICHRMDRLNDENECSICSSLKLMSDMIISKNDSFFAVMRHTDGGIELPFGYTLKAYSWDEMRSVMANDRGYVRLYAKNKPVTGSKAAANLWVGDYSAEKEFHKLIENSDGIKRLGVIRADVDNLGQAFVEGFAQKDGRYETVSRTAVFSRKLSMYFKQYVNVLLNNGKYTLYKDKPQGKRNAVIVYSGGDDLFIVGGWDDIIGFAVDLYNSFKRFTQGTLTFSAGIGIYPEKYPISAMAAQTGGLEDIAKGYDSGSKNSVALFDEMGAYHWEELINKVLGEKLALIQGYISVNDQHNKAMLYNMLELIRDKNSTSRLNIARFAYLLARLKPAEEKVSDEKMQLYRDFSKNMYSWIQNEKDCRELITAIYIFIYMTRERDVENNEAAK